MKSLNILIVDDHPTIIEAYKNILISGDEKSIELNFIIAYNCKEAYEKINNKAYKYDVALLDFKLPPYPSENIKSGADLAFLIKKKYEKCKIIILTSSHELFILYDLIKKVNPEGMLMKSDFTSEELELAFHDVLKGNIYYSQTVRNSLKIIKEKDLYLDSINRQLISLLAKGIQTKNLPQYLNISLSTIDKRKSLIKLFLGIEKGSDEEIVKLSKEKGYI